VAKEAQSSVGYGMREKLATRDVSDFNIGHREGNRRSGVALAMRHRLSGISTYGLNGLGNGDSTPPKLHSEYYGIFTFYVIHVMHYINLRYLLTDTEPMTVHCLCCAKHRRNLRGYEGYRYPTFWTEGSVLPLFRT